MPSNAAELSPEGAEDAEEEEEEDAEEEEGEGEDAPPPSWKRDDA
jgi:hypothetical protein